MLLQHAAESEREISHLARSANLLEGLYILLALISLFFIFFTDFSETNYLRIRWTK